MLYPVPAHLREPYKHLRSLIPETAVPTFDRVMGRIDMPIDQAHIAHCAEVCFSSVAAYLQRLPNLRAEWVEVREHAQEIARVAREARVEVEGTPPAAQLTGRLEAFPTWAMLMAFRPEHKPLLHFAGAFFVDACTSHLPVPGGVCTHIRRDLVTFGRPGARDEVNMDDLIALGFGKRWFTRYARTDRRLTKLLTLLPRPPSTDDEAAPSLEGVEALIQALRSRFVFAQPSRRRGTHDKSKLPANQLRAITLAVRQSIEAGNAASTAKALHLLTGFSPWLLGQLPVLRAGDPLDGIGLDPYQGVLRLDLNRLLPSRARPQTTVADLFEPVSDELWTHVPQFVCRPIRDGLEQFEGAKCVLSDLIDVRLDTRASQIPGSTCTLKPSLAKARRTMGWLALQQGASRGCAAAVTWELELTGKASWYYRRLLATDVRQTTSDLMRETGWDEADHPILLHCTGSHMVLKERAVLELFSHFQNKCRESRPARRCGLQPLLEHHAHFACATAFMAAFNMGLREADEYQLYSDDVLRGDSQVVINDKGGGRAERAMYAVANAVVRSQFKLWIGHCKAEARRLAHFDDPIAAQLRKALLAVIAGEHVPFIPVVDGEEVVGIGSTHVFRSLPERLQVRVNVGRHFWCNKLDSAGLSSWEVALFMRHVVVGLESNTSCHSLIRQQAFSRVMHAQEALLEQLGVCPVSGLRRTA
jgi:hypothetical protein